MRACHWTGALLLASVASGCQWVLGYDALPHDDFADAGAAHSSVVSLPCPKSSVDGCGSMRQVPRGDGDGFWMDAREVSRGEYDSFLKDPGPQQRGACAWNVALTDPACEAELNVAALKDHPMVCVDQCDATRYCEQQGKQLCHGHIVQDADDDWYLACSNQGQTAYPFGREPKEDLCNLLQDGTESTEAVDQRPLCVNDVGVENLVGNVWEWVGGDAACKSQTDASDECLARGGSFATRLEAARCDTRYNPARGTTRDDLGFRCCAYP